MAKVGFAVTVMDQSRASVRKMIEADAGYGACSESSVVSTQRENGELRSLPTVGESESRRYEGGKARSKQRSDGAPVIAGWISALDAGRGLSKTAIAASVGVSTTQSSRKASETTFGDSGVVKA